VSYLLFYLLWPPVAQHMDDQALCVGPFFLSFQHFFAGLSRGYTPLQRPGFFFVRKEREAMKKLLTLTETGEVTNRSVKALRQLIYRGKFPFTKVGGRIFVDSTELSRFLELSRKTTAEEAAGREAA
jgi:hypothetical protein